ncbi:MAG: hemolysin III family protein [Ruminococcaceae bacterium]|nr:hemolysin III family protein [Oscillospiraceae bacterium]
MCVYSLPYKGCFRRRRNRDFRGNYIWLEYGSALYSFQHLPRFEKGHGKKVLQILDHCTIYALIAGTYSIICMGAFVPAYPLIGWGLLGWQWALAALAITLTAIDLKKYTAFSMICYVGMGWSVICFVPHTIEVMSATGFYMLLGGGMAYTIGAVLYGVGKKKRWIHSVFHIFVVLGSVLQFLAIYFYVL